MSPRLIPPLLHAMSARISAARAVAACISQSLPYGDDIQAIKAEINNVGCLGNAVEELLALLERDIEQLEVELRAI